jgi:hypothetical protein
MPYDLKVCKGARCMPTRHERMLFHSADVLSDSPQANHCPALRWGVVQVCKSGHVQGHRRRFMC